MLNISLLYKGYRLVPLSDRDYGVFKSYREKVSLETDNYFTADVSSEVFSYIYLETTKPGNYGFLIVKGGNVVGEVFIRGATAGNASFISSLVLVKSEQGKGVGTGLLKVVESLCKSNGSVRCELVTDRKNKGLFSFYCGNGYKPSFIDEDSVSFVKVL